MATSKMVTVDSEISPVTSHWATEIGNAPPMRSDLVEKAAAIVKNHPVLVNMVSSRVRQLNMGRPPLIRVIERVGQADIALMEIIEGKIVVDESYLDQDNSK